MKKISVVFIAILAIILAACATPAGAATQVNGTPAAGNGVSNSNTPLNPASQLAVGTINLKTTSYAVTADQAATLLPLWEGLRALSSSTTFSQQEYDALVKQIQSAMSSDQMNAIKSMNLTQADIGKVMQSLGPANGFSGGRANANGTPIARTPGARPGATGGTGSGRGGGFDGGGGFPGGGGFGGGFGGAAGGGANRATPATQATIIAREAQRANQENVFLDNVVINFLQQLTGVSPTTAGTPMKPGAPSVTEMPTPASTITPGG